MQFIKKALILAGYLARVTYARMKGCKVIAFHVSVPLHFNFIKGLLQNLSRDKRFYVLVFCGFSCGKDCFFKPGIVYTERMFVLPRIKADLIITEDDWTCPYYKKSKLVHIMHSIASTHVIYPDGTFDGFDFIFCAGPHHKRELSAIFKKKNITGCELIEAGYEVVDSLIKHNTSVRDMEKRMRPCVLFAPSWGENNALAKHGPHIIDALIGEYTVILRPHLLNMEMDKKVIEEITKKYTNNEHFVLDDKPDSIPSLMRADIMISDWSGVAFEYALSRLKPVVFIDVPMKEINKRWELFMDEPGIECIYREKIGIILNDISVIKTATEELIQSEAAWAERIATVRPELLYNTGNCAVKAYEAVAKISLGLAGVI